MIPIKKYIIESLFDSEDDLIGKKTSQESLNWFSDENNAWRLWDTDKNTLSDQLQINTKGEVAIKRTYGDTIRLFKPIPNWIKLDKESWDIRMNINIEYPIKSQKDIPEAGIITSIENNKELKNISVRASSSMYEDKILKLHDIKYIKNLNIKFISKNTGFNFISVINSNVDFKDISEIHSGNLNNTFRIIFINDKGPLVKYLKNVYKLVTKGARTTYEITEYIKEFNQMIDNNIQGFYINTVGCLELTRYMDSPCIIFYKTSPAEKTLISNLKNII